MESLEKKLGYHFQDLMLLSEALNHSSYANEHRGGLGSNERLEFLGDSVLGFVSAEYLFQGHKDLPEGDLTRMRASLVCEQSLYEVARELDLGSYLKLGRGEEAGGGRERQSILADAVEAVFAAVYLDGGIEPVRELIIRVLLSRAPAAEERKDYKTTLQEVVQRQSGQVLTYHMVSQSGPDHNKTFLFEVRLNDHPVGQGTGRSKKEAEQAAAKDALEQSWADGQSRS
ncbi:MAG: ribonuclease III [Oscillibacter sp.]|nr:ribonuclease III [Oscillibacter sp.]